MRSVADIRSLLAAGAAESAAAACRAALEECFDDARALHGLGLCLLAQGAPAQAAALLSAAPDPDAERLLDLSRALRAAGLVEEAELRLRQAVDAAPGRGEVRSELAETLVLLGRTDEALAMAGDDPDDPAARRVAAMAHLAAGNAALAGHDPVTAADCYRAALVAQPGYVAALGNLGNALAALGDVPGALAAYRDALEREPGSRDIGYAYGLALPLDGQVEAGWRWQECRREVDALRWNFERRPALPQWQPGMPLAGRVLVTAEQGLGDVIQHVRFVPRMSGCAVTLELPPALLGVFGDLAPVIGTDEPAPDVDLAIPLMSLPLALGLAAADIPAAPYVTPDPDRMMRWAAWLGNTRGARRVGIVCSGDPRHPHDALRSVPLARLAPILSTPGCRFVLMQNDIRMEDRATRARFTTLRAPGAALVDMADTAGLLSQLDLLVSVDTAVAHLAGAMGVPTWLMVAHVPDSRWMLGRADTPWYDSMTLYRQPSRGDWDSVIEDVRRDLLRPMNGP